MIEIIINWFISFYLTAIGYIAKELKENREYDKTMLTVGFYYLKTLGLVIVFG